MYTGIYFLLFAGSRLDRNGIIVLDLVSDPAFSRQRKLFVLFRNLLVFIIRKYCRYVLNGKEGDWKEKLLLLIRIRPNPILILYRNNLHFFKFCKFSCRRGQPKKDGSGSATLIIGQLGNFYIVIL